MKLVTVEPSFLAYQLAYECLSDLNANLFLQKSCRFDRTHEPDLSTKCDDERQGILFVSEAYLKFSSVVLLLNWAFSIFALPWSDKAGQRRRPLIFIPIVGIMLLSLLGCLHSYFWQWAPITAVVSTTVVAIITGGSVLITTALQVYICDIYDGEIRTARLGFLGAIRIVGLIFGKGGSGIILRKVGFFYSYLLCFVGSVCGLIFASIFIKDTSVAVEKEIPFCRMFSNIGYDLIDNFRVVFRKSLASKRIIVLLLLMTNLAVCFTYFGELSVLYQYLRYRFGWNEQEYSEYMFYKFSTSALGVVFCSAVLSEYFKLHDGLIGMLAATFDIIAVLWLFFAIQPWQIFLLPLIDIFHSTALVITMSFVSKYYHPNELGRLMAVFCVFALPTALSYPVYNAIYQSTLDTFPAAFCLPSIALDIVVLACMCGAYVLSRELDRSAPTQNSTVAKLDVPEGDGDEVTATTPMKVLR